ncbi:MAG: transglutaminase domain-containing protein [Phycisphaerales bacterium]
MRLRSLASIGMLLVGAASAGAVAQPEQAPPRVSEVKLAEALRGERAQLVLVKDFMPIRNKGGTVKSIEFDRYLAPSDPEQFVVGRWVDAATDGGTPLPISVVGVRGDEAGNVIQRYRLSPLPAKQFVTVTVTTLVARRECPEPTGPNPIPKPDAYLPDVLKYLDATTMVARDDPVVVAAAEKILAKTTDAYRVATEIAALARARTYLPSGAGGPEPKSLAATVLQRGGSCCASAVAAAAVLRRCGIPAQVTYCPPPSYVHGIVRFWVNGHGWVRMDATSGTGNLPLIQEEGALSLVRLYDMPIEMESLDWAYAWPWHNNDDDGEYTFWSEGKPVLTVAFEARDEEEVRRRGSGISGYVAEPFMHLEPGSWSALLGSEPIGPGTPWEDWDGLVAAARASVNAKTVGRFPAVMDKLPALAAYADRAESWCRPGVEAAPK